MSSPRAAVFTRSYFPRYVGGGERLVQLTAAGLRACGVETTIVTTGDDPAEERFDGTPVQVLPSRDDAFEAAAEAALARLRPQTVHLVGAWRLGPMVRAARRVGARVGVAGLDYGQFCDNHRLVRGSGAMCEGRRSATDCFRCGLERERWRDRALGQVGGWLPGGASAAVGRMGAALLGRPFGRQLGWRAEFAKREDERAGVLAGIDMFLAPTRFAEQHMRRHLPASTACERLMYPVADDLIAAEPKVPDAARLRVGFIGRCLRIKGIHVAIAAIARLRGRVPATLRIAAAVNGAEEREYYQALQAEIRDASDISWEEHGVLDAAALRAFHAGLDVLVVPSLWPEYVGFVTLEALALGSPVILSDFASQRELVEGPDDGVVVPAGDVEALAAALTDCWNRKQGAGLPATRTPAMPASEYARRLLEFYDAAPSRDHDVPVSA